MPTKLETTGAIFPRSYAATNSVAFHLRSQLRNVLVHIEYMRRAQLNERGDDPPEWWDDYTTLPLWINHTGECGPEPDADDRVAFARLRLFQVIHNVRGLWERITSGLPMSPEVETLLGPCLSALESLRFMLDQVPGYVPDGRQIRDTLPDLWPGPVAELDQEEAQAKWATAIAHHRRRYSSGEWHIKWGNVYRARLARWKALRAARHDRNAHELKEAQARGLVTPEQLRAIKTQVRTQRDELARWNVCVGDLVRLVGFLESEPPLVPTASPSTASSPLAAIRNRRKRRQKRAPEDKPFTEVERLTFEVVSRHRGNIAAAARELGKDSKTVKENHDRAFKKAQRLEASSRSVRTRRTPKDPRGQDVLPADDRG